MGHASLASESFRSFADEDEAPDPMVSGVYLRVLADVVTRRGVSADDLLQNEALDFATHEPIEVRVPLGVYRRVLARAITLTGEPAIGLYCGVHATVSAYDLLGPLVAHVPNLRAAFAQVRQFQALGLSGAFLHLSEQSGVARVRWEFPHAHDATDRTLAEFLMAGTARMVRAFARTRGALQAAYFEHRSPAYHHAYATVFEGKERFSEDFTGLEFDARLLDKPHLHSNPALLSLVHSQAEQRLARVAKPSNLIDRVRVYLRNETGAGIPEMAVAARGLGVSVRSLSRRLAEQNISYRMLTQEAQRERACAMLRNPDFTVQAVAEALAFQDTASFYRAFKRWTGQTACEYRAKH